MAQRKKRVVSDGHKAAMTEGRHQSRAISAYLEALDTQKPKPGRKRTPESIDRRLAAIDKQLPAVSAIRRLSLIQEPMDLLRERGSLGATVDLSAFEKEFVASAKGYSARKGISYAAWRELGVPAAVLNKAGIGRGA